ncbi:hypothetical protein Y032_0032g2564 [Ancylostoma ceylanicum]|nr:hypothetical protein Y032_0032g2564 [Ancylostoma ceylanicum]
MPHKWISNLTCTKAPEKDPTQKRRVPLFRARTCQILCLWKKSLARIVDNITQMPMLFGSDQMVDFQLKYGASKKLGATAPELLHGPNS